MTTSFPKNFNTQKSEKKLYRKWQKQGLFTPSLNKKYFERKNYSIVMPPPNVTGVLHLGHALTLTLEDILIRYHRMKGFKTVWIPGTDHAAIATQTKVEKLLKEEGKTRHDLNRVEFLKRVEKFAKESRYTIVNQIKKMGSSCDWSREAYTLDKTRTKVVRLVFKMMFEDKLIYRGKRIVNWCPRCHSTLADDEVEYKKQKTFLYTFKYDENFPFAISTTRPETKLGDTAVAVNPKDMRYQKFIGKTFKAVFCGIPLEIKIISDQSVDPNFGTGALGVTPAHSLIDWKIAQAHNLQMIEVINENGLIKEGFGKFSQKSVLKARTLIVEHLKKNKNNLLLQKEEIENNLSVCYRCNTPIEPLPSLQWFINVNKRIGGKSLKELAKDAVKKGIFGRSPIRIIPKRFEKNYFNWINNLEDWCISRQIWFGHQVPVFFCWDCNQEKLINSPFAKKIFLEKKGSLSFESVKKMIEKEGHFIGSEKIRFEPYVEEPRQCSCCGSKKIIKSSETLDTWFSSGLWTFSTLAKEPNQVIQKNNRLLIKTADFRNFHPTSVLETGYDILFFWVARMIIMTAYAVKDIPFKDVYLHGLVLDKYGKKMSKSKGNAINPIEIIDKYGTDALRFSLVSDIAPGNDLKFFEEKVIGQRNLINKFWNISRFIITNTSLISSKKFIQEKKLFPSDFWIIAKMKNLIEEVENSIEKYDFSLAAEKIRQFTWHNLADWYLEASKFEKNQSEKTFILQKILNDLLKIWHPFAPFITEEIQQKIAPQKPLAVSSWPRTDFYQKIFRNSQCKKMIQQFEIAKKIISEIRNIRSEFKISPTQKINLVAVGKEIALQPIKIQEKLIKSIRTGIEKISFENKISSDQLSLSAYVGLENLEILVPLREIIDYKKEKERLLKELSEIETLLQKQLQKIKNKNFIQKAPLKIVEKEKKKLENFKIRFQKIKRYLQFLS